MHKLVAVGLENAEYLAEIARIRYRVFKSTCRIIYSNDETIESGFYVQIKDS